MNVYVRSRWQTHPRGFGYFWQPREPRVVASIESTGDLSSDNYRTMALWFHVASLKLYTYWLMISGLDSGYTDGLNRPIKHTVLWGGRRFWNQRQQEQLRNIMLQFLEHNRLETTLRSLISPDTNVGFRWDRDRIANIGLAPEPGALDPEGLSQSCSDAIARLRRECLPPLPTIVPHETGGLLVAAGERLSLRLKRENHKYLAYAADVDWGRTC